MAGTAVPVAAADAGITVEPILPNNQIDHSKPYFDLLMQAGEEQELVLMITNNTAFDVEVSIEAITASTAPTGLINYTTQPELAEETLENGFAQLAEVPVERVQIAAGAAEQVTVTVHMPEQPLEGVILGAIHVVQETVTPEQGSLSYQYAYAIAVQLSTGSERPDLNFEIGDVFLSPKDNRVAVTTHIRNITPVVGKKLSLRAVLYDQQGNSYISHSTSELEMAPNSIFPLLLYDELGIGLDPGDYRVEVQLSSGETEWNLESVITLSADQLSGLAYNRGSGFQMPSIFRLILFILGALVVAALLAFGGLMLHIRKENKKYEEYMRRMKRKDEDNAQGGGYSQ